MYSFPIYCPCVPQLPGPSKWPLNQLISLNSEVTLTSKFQGQMISWLSLKKCMVRFARNKSSLNKLLDLFHTWPRPLTLRGPWPWISKVKSWNCHICEISELIANNNDNMKEGELFGWFDILLTICDLHFAFIICCRSGVTFLWLAISVWPYHYCNGDGINLIHNTSWSVPFTHYHIWNSQNFR